MDKLILRETKRQTPGPAQVEIEVFAAALNFRDIMKAPVDLKLAISHT